MDNKPHGLRNPILLHTDTKTQPNATSTTYVIAKYVKTNVPTKLGIYAIYAK